MSHGDGQQCTFQESLDDVQCFGFSELRGMAKMAGPAGEPGEAVLGAGEERVVAEDECRALCCANTTCDKWLFRSEVGCWGGIAHTYRCRKDEGTRGWRGAKSKLILSRSGDGSARVRDESRDEARQTAHPRDGLRSKEGTLYAGGRGQSGVRDADWGQGEQQKERGSHDIRKSAAARVCSHRWLQGKGVAGGWVSRDAPSGATMEDEARGGGWGQERRHVVVVTFVSNRVDFVALQVRGRAKLSMNK